MTVLIKYPKHTKKSLQDFIKRKDQELTNLDWAKWGGWWDTDGSFSTNFNKWKASWQRESALSLRDRQPVELFSKTFETSLTLQKHKTITPEPYRYEYIENDLRGELRGEKAIWFTKNVYPFLIKQEKKDYAATLLGYRPESKDFTIWTNDEATHYLATVMEGDGCIRCASGKKTKHLTTIIRSSDVQYLVDIKYLVEDKLGFMSYLSEGGTYKTRQGIKTKYGLSINCSLTGEAKINLGFFQSLVKDGVMTLDRKKQKVQEFLNYKAA